MAKATLEDVVQFIAKKKNKSLLESAQKRADKFYKLAASETDPLKKARHEREAQKTILTAAMLAKRTDDIVRKIAAPKNGAKKKRI